MAKKKTYPFSIWDLFGARYLSDYADTLRKRLDRKIKKLQKDGEKRK